MADLSPDKHFYVNDGKVIKSLKELPEVLPSISESSFKHHVNENKNDFANWVRHVFQRHELADKLEKTRSKEETIELVKGELRANEKQEVILPKGIHLKKDIEENKDDDEEWDTELPLPPLPEEQEKERVEILGKNQKESKLSKLKPEHSEDYFEKVLDNIEKDNLPELNISKPDKKLEPKVLRRIRLPFVPYPKPEKQVEAHKEINKSITNISKKPIAKGRPDSEKAALAEKPVANNVTPLSDVQLEELINDCKEAIRKKDFRSAKIIFGKAKEIISKTKLTNEEAGRIRYDLDELDIEIKLNELAS